MSAAMEYHTQDFATQVAEAHRAVYSVAEASLELGKAQERERIIALLAEYYKGCEPPIDFVIALIKGENE